MSLPIKGPISQPFGPTSLTVEPTMYGQKAPDGTWWRCKPTTFSGGKLFNDFHPAVDIVCPVGTPVRAPADGVLLRRETYRVLWQGKYVYGNAIYFRFGTRILYVDHLSTFVAKEGQKVAAGGLLARTGNSGASFGPHAHLEVRAATDPHLSWSAFRLNPVRVF